MLEFIFSAAFGSFSVLGFYHLIGFCKRRQEKAFVVFSLMLLLLSMYSLVNNPLIFRFSDNASGLFAMNHATRFRLNVLLTDILAPICLAYLGFLFPKDFSSKITIIAVLAVFVSSLIAVILPYDYGIIWEDSFNESLVNVILLYLLWGCAKAVSKKRDDAIPLVIALMPGIITGIFINLMANRPAESEAQKSLILITGTLTAVILQAIVLSDRNARACEKLESTAISLTECNRAFSRFVPHALLSLIGKNDITTVDLGDHSLHYMTVMFVDIRGFTSLSETMSPEDNFVFLNNLMKEVGPLIRKNGGLIDKYIGDGIMALFPGDPKNSLKAAVGIKSALNEYNKFRIKNYMSEITVGIGIHSGGLMIGTIGEPERMDCTVISDAVNTAARLERATKLYGCTIIVSEELIKSIDNTDRCSFRRLGSIRPKGKKSPVSIIEVFTGDHPEMVFHKHRTKEEFETGLEFYQQGRFKDAYLKFAEVVEGNEDDIVALYYYSKSLFYIINGIPIDWDGVENIDVK